MALYDANIMNLGAMAAVRSAVCVPCETYNRLAPCAPHFRVHGHRRGLQGVAGRAGQGRMYNEGGSC